MSGPSERCQIVNTPKKGAEWSEEEIALNNQPEALSFLLKSTKEELNGGLNRNRYGIVVDFNKHKRAAADQHNQDAIKQDNITNQDNTARSLKANAPASDHVSRPILDNGSNNKFTGQKIAGSDAGKFKGLAGSRYGTNLHRGGPRHPLSAMGPKAKAPASDHISRPIFDDGLTTKFTGQEIAGSDFGKFKGLAGSRYA
ncbi:uncharacterized protein L3040_004095 [Drepanopeziza brunnea f. sp. 'multigermtubi']|uniref:Uncharacterized protein n=1 Tax=Marssonina brunnea f. sp. multigermtubi (strain MB_m1) TaxID=1072389 RepID=K1X1F3_MARBU|nr:uncharacterized protein MBM_03094 [Drepanopeziza brunnea f. sp. 'multigermtubi' MB_m1]EKD18852.1 hypothetical protein MBM_03094 [Drepanopeziza brunnea f. sp. 'multigermtubi' MB_m1]KAJ5042696.1 hypothetical protein L3040_004095 [Drepanopeziza brunnea f. sp. 'multigermtubi']